LQRGQLIRNEDLNTAAVIGINHPGMDGEASVKNRTAPENLPIPSGRYLDHNFEVDTAVLMRTESALGGNREIKASIRWVGFYR
jgi:hypothetical protein